MSSWPRFQAQGDIHSHGEEFITTREQTSREIKAGLTPTNETRAAQRQGEGGTLGRKEGRKEGDREGGREGSRQTSLKRQHPNKAWKEEKGLEIRTFQAEERAWANALESRHELEALGS